MSQRLSLMTPEEFDLEVQRLMAESGVSCFDAVQHICDERQYEVDSIPELLTPRLKEQLSVEARARKLLKDNRTPPSLTL